jgi:hypothetical protein
MKFTADASGLITGLRFYKGPTNTGPHLADLWSSNGTLLATATFTNETASGWQQVNFATPVAITAGTTYIASYHTSGFYSMDSNYFTSSVVNGDLTAQAGVNGVFSYGSGSVFPTNTSSTASNYWVDVVYTKTLSAPVAKDDSGFVVNENGSITISASTLLANDIYRGLVQRNATDETVTKLARIFVPIVALVAVLFTLHGGETIVALLLMGYNFVTQLFPAVICSIAPRNRATKQGAFCGIAVGVAVVAATTLFHMSVGQMMPFLPDALKDVNIGFVALALNVVVLAIVSALTQPQPQAEQSHAH